MKNTRKRLLVSSVAALLVSTMALSSATFAWFTTSSQATADKLAVKTIQSSELVLSNFQSIKDQVGINGWTDHISYTTSNTLKPASSVDGVNWFSAEANAKTAFTAKDGTAVQHTIDAAKQGGYIFYDRLNVMNRGSADINNVTINFKLNETAIGDETGKYLRLAFAQVDKKEDEAGLKLKDGTDDVKFADHVYSVGADSAEAVSAITDSKITKTVKIDATDAKSGVSLNIGTLKGKTNNGGESGQAKFYRLFVWFEGQDTDCYDAYAGHKMPEITFTVTGDTAAQN